MQNILLKTIFAIFLISINTTSLIAKKENTPPFRYSFDLELYDKSFPTFIREFADIDYIEKNINWNIYDDDWIDIWIDNYLDNPKAFSNLPDDIKIKLEKGLDQKKVNLNPYEKTIEIQQSQKQISIKNDNLPRGVKIIGDKSADSHKPSIIGLGGNKIDSNKNITTVSDSNSKKLLESAKSDFNIKGLIKTKSGILVSDDINLNLVNSQVNHAKIKHRWISLPLKEKIRLVKFKYLPPQTLAQIVMTSKIKHTDLLKLKIDPNNEILKHLKFEWDIITPEVKLKNSFTSLEELNAYLENFTKQTKLYRSIFDPMNDSRQAGGIHYHISAKGIDPFEADKIMEKYKIQNMIENYYEVSKDIIKGTETNSYFLSFKGRGNVRKVSDLHYELRQAVEGPYEALSYVKKILSLPPAEAHNLLDQKLFKLSLDKRFLQLIDDLDKDKRNYKFLIEATSPELKNYRSVFQNKNKLTTKNYIDKMKKVLRKLDVSNVESYINNHFKKYIGFLRSPDAYSKENISRSFNVILEKIKLDEFDSLLDSENGLNLKRILSSNADLISNHTNETSQFIRAVFKEVNSGYDPNGKKLRDFITLTTTLKQEYNLPDDIIESLFKRITANGYFIDEFDPYLKKVFLKSLIETNNNFSNDLLKQYLQFQIIDSEKTLDEILKETDIKLNDLKKNKLFLKTVGEVVYEGHNINIDFDSFYKIYHDLDKSPILIENMKPSVLKDYILSNFDKTKIKYLPEQNPMEKRLNLYKSYAETFGDNEVILKMLSKKIGLNNLPRKYQRLVKKYKKTRRHSNKPVPTNRFSLCIKDIFLNFK